jgi:uncharacterized damage-inducible protein DinB
VISTSNIADPAAKIFLNHFFTNRNINREFYKRVPTNKLDFRIVDTPEKRSDSIRESLAHQIGVERDYITALDTGKLQFVSGENKQDLSLDKDELLRKIEELDAELVQKLSNNEIANKKVTVLWNRNPLPAITMLYGLNEHEILHTGWNLALMDMLHIERFPELKEMWG